MITKTYLYNETVCSQSEEEPICSLRILERKASFRITSISKSEFNQKLQIWQISLHAKKDTGNEKTQVTNHWSLCCPQGGSHSVEEEEEEEPVFGLRHVVLGTDPSIPIPFLLPERSSPPAVPPPPPTQPPHPAGLFGKGTQTKGR